MMTPYEKLKSLSQAEIYLRFGITFKGLETIANQMSNNQFAERMVNARSNLFQLSFNKSQDLLTGLAETLLFRLIFQLA